MKASLTTPTRNSKTTERYRLYIDESGDHTNNQFDKPAHRYLALLGVWFQQGKDYTAYAQALDQMKCEIFGPRPDRPVILVRSAIINCKGPFVVLRDDHKRRHFDEEWLKIIGQASFRIVCVVIDKKTHQERYENPFHPYHYCLAVMLERYCRWLHQRNAVGDVMAEARGREEDLQLKAAYRRLYESGTQWFNYERFQQTLTSKDIKVETKNANIAGLQLADNLAHPLKMACLAERNLVAYQPSGFARRLLDIVEPKLLHKDGQVWGWGKKML